MKLPKRAKVEGAWREARDLIVAHRRRLAWGLALLLVGRLAGMVLPASVKWLVDDVAGKGRGDLLAPWAIAIGVCTLLQAGSSFALSQILGVAAQRAINDLRKRVQAHVIRLPVRVFESTQSGILITRVMNDAEGIRNLVGNGIVELIGGLVTASVAFTVLLYSNWRLTLVTIGVLAVAGTVSAFAFKRLRPAFRERGKLHAAVTGRLNESFGGVRVVKAYAAEPGEDAAFGSGIDRLMANIARTITGTSAYGAFMAVCIGSVGMLMFLFGGHAILAGTMTAGELMMFLAFTALLAAPVGQIASIGTQITEAFAGLDRIRELLSEDTESKGDPERAACASLHGDVEFENVTFSYKPGVPVLREISFRAPAGSTTALVGSSGSGKSTLVGLVMAFHHPDTGRVIVDGRDLSGLRLAEFRAQLGVVPQEGFLFDGTIAENVAFARPGASRGRIEEVCRIANCDEFALGFEKGYDTVIGERGIKLSGGQRQRLSIARALLADPRILILDEATSSLDSESEARIQQALTTLRASRTTFVIAHRLSTIRAADQILVLEEGRIVEHGTHPELLARGGRYRQLYDCQYHFEHERFVNPGEELRT